MVTKYFEIRKVKFYQGLFVIIWNLEELMRAIYNIILIFEDKLEKANQVYLFRDDK